MIRPAMIAAALAVAGPALAQTQPPAASAPRVGDGAVMWRASFLVADMDKALAVWRDILGFSPAYASASTLDDPRLRALYGLPEGTKLDLVVLISGNLAIGNIGFLRPHGGAALPPAAGAPQAALFVKTTRLDDVTPRLVAAGCTLIAGPGDGAAAGRNRMAWFVDPNGVRFVLTERASIDLVYPNR